MQSFWELHLIYVKFLRFNRFRKPDRKKNHVYCRHCNQHHQEPGGSGTMLPAAINQPGFRLRAVS
jgi:hypothetical protein